MHKIKRVDRLLKAFTRIHTKFPKAKLLIAGPDAGEKSRLETLAHTLGIFPDIQFLGEVYGKNKDHCFQESDIFVSLSDDDPFGLSVLEALFHNLPVCISSLIGIAQYISDTKCGVVTKNPDDEMGVAKDIIKTYEERSRFQSNIPKMLHQFNPKKTQKQYIDLYNKLINA